MPPTAYEGRIRPSLIAATSREAHPVYEGRIRPSLIAAGELCQAGRREVPTRGEFAPPSLRRGGRLATRGEFAPPSLGDLRGANSPLPHCGNFQPRISNARRGLRGANSPLPHCGPGSGRGSQGTIRLRGANSPLPHCGMRVRTTRNEKPESTRGEFAPPSLRPFPSDVPQLPLNRLRGANSPLPHCGDDTLESGVGYDYLRGANSPLPHCGGLMFFFNPDRSDYEGRIRPSLIAAA